MSAAKSARGFIPVATPVDESVIQEVQRIARIGAEELGTVVGEPALMWNEEAGGYDVRCMVVPRAGGALA